MLHVHSGRIPVAKLALVAGCCLFIIAAAGVCEDEKEGPRNDTNDVAIPVGTDGWLSTWDGLPSLVDPTPEPGPTVLVGEVDEPIVEPVGEPVDVPVPPPAPVGGVEEIICAYPWDCAKAIRVVSCETGGTFNPAAYNPAGPYYGWWQIGGVHFWRPECPGDRMFDPVANTACAWALYQEQGWAPWPWCGQY